MHKSVKKRIYFAIFSFIIVASVGTVLVWQLQKNMVFFYTPSQVINQQNTNKNIWLGGIVQSYLEQEIDSQILHKFVVTDYKQNVEVVYSGALPTLFKVGQGVVVYGKLIAKTVHANRVAVKHDEVYMTKESYQKIRKSI